MLTEFDPHALLAWYLEAGVDETIGESPQDRFAPRPAPALTPALTPAPSGPEAPAAAAAAPPRPVGTSAHVAAECKTLDALRRALDAFDGLPLKLGATSTVFADGNPDAAVMVIGEAPGQDEDRMGRPFVGPSGKLLDRMLGSIGLDRTSAYITNVVPWRPPANRKPTPDEVAVCLPFVIRHIELVDPQILILLGGAAAAAVLGRHEGINRLRGRWFEYSSPGLPRPIQALATFHPAYLLRTPEAKREAWRDFLNIEKSLKKLP